MSGKRAKAIRRQFREQNRYAAINAPWIDGQGTRRGNALRVFKREQVKARPAITSLGWNLTVKPSGPITSAMHGSTVNT